LSAEAKEKAREWYKEIDDMPFLEDDMQETLQDLLKKAKIECKDAKVFYSLSYSQGDGAMFEGVCTFKGHAIQVKQSGHYYHYNSKEITYLDFVGEDKEGKEEAIAEAFEAKYTEVCKELAKAGYAYMEDAHSDSTIDDTLSANEYTFTETGKRFG
jgi:hypothetical protein